MDYMTLLLNTYFNEKSIFSEVIQNRQIQLEKEKNISKLEFFFNCNKVVGDLKHEIYLGYNNQLIKYHEVLEIAENQNDTDVINSVNNEIEKLDQTKIAINLLHYSKGNFKGNLYLNDIIFIEESLHEIQYASDKKNEIEANEDAYNHYLNTGRFVLSFTFPVYRSNQYKEVINTLKEYRTRYDYIFERLTAEQRIEFKYDFLDKLIELEKHQTASKFKRIISKLIEDIENSEAKNNLKESNKQVEIKELDKVKDRYSSIFKDNGFDVFEKYFVRRNLNCGSRTDLRLIFELLKKDDLLNDTVELKHYINWLNSTYGCSLTELKKVDLNTSPNIQRINEYKEIKGTTLK